MPECPQDLPASGPAREALREKGQFWTPAWVAEAMVAYALGGGADSLFDPAVGAGAFFSAAEVIARETGWRPVCWGVELHRSTLDHARGKGVPEAHLKGVAVGDFVLDPPAGPFPAIVANPPYIRHHRLSAGIKASLRRLGASLLGTPLDGRAGLHVYFLLRALSLLQEGGRLAFIVPADTCEGVFAPSLWRWISRGYRLDAVVTFTPDASPFPGVDTNPLVLMIRGDRPAESFLWAQCLQTDGAALRQWALKGLPAISSPALDIHTRSLSEGLATGLSRPPTRAASGGPVLREFASVMRGIATGANGFFHLTRAQAADLSIPDEFLLSAVGRTRDVPGDEVTPETMATLDSAGRPTLLFSPDGRPQDQFPPAVQQYLSRGVAMGLPQRRLIATRRPWYRMERRRPPPILFAYLGRRSARFIRNRGGGVPLTGFLCVYPHRKDDAFVEALWRVLSDDRTVANLPLVGKSYGGGAIKVEPRALETLPLPPEVVESAGLVRPGKPTQLRLL